MKKLIPIIVIFSVLLLQFSGCKKNDGIPLNSKAVNENVIVKTSKYGKDDAIDQTFNVKTLTQELKKGNPATLKKPPTILNGQFGSIYVHVDYDAQMTSIEKKQNGKTIWTCKIAHILFEYDVLASDNGYYVYGTATENQPWFGIIFYIDENGAKKWEKTYSHGDTEFLKAVPYSGGVALFGNFYQGYGDSKKWFLIHKEYSITGDETFTKLIQIGTRFNISAVAKIDNNYLLKLGHYEDNGNLILVPKDGDIQKEFSFCINGKPFVVQDVSYMNGKLYLSCMADNFGKDAFDKSFSELSEEHDKVWSKKNGARPDYVKMSKDYDRKLNKLFQSQYLSAMIVCDKDIVPLSVVFVENARCAELSVEGNDVSWSVDRIDEVKNVSPMLSSRRVDMAARTFSLNFNDGSLKTVTSAGTKYLMY